MIYMCNHVHIAATLQIQAERLASCGCFSKDMAGPFLLRIFLLASSREASSSVSKSSSLISWRGAQSRKLKSNWKYAVCTDCCCVKESSSAWLPEASVDMLSFRCTAKCVVSVEHSIRSGDLWWSPAHVKWELPPNVAHNTWHVSSPGLCTRRRINPTFFGCNRNLCTRRRRNPRNLYSLKLKT